MGHQFQSIVGQKLIGWWIVKLRLQTNKFIFFIFIFYFLFLFLFLFFIFYFYFLFFIFYFLLFYFLFFIFYFYFLFFILFHCHHYLIIISLLIPIYMSHPISLLLKFLTSTTPFFQLLTIQHFNNSFLVFIKVTKETVPIHKILCIHLI
jgi:hypothetical protein